MLAANIAEGDEAERYLGDGVPFRIVFSTVRRFARSRPTSAGSPCTRSAFAVVTMFEAIAGEFEIAHPTRRYTLSHFGELSELLDVDVNELARLGILVAHLSSGNSRDESRESPNSRSTLMTVDRG